MVKIRKFTWITLFLWVGILCPSFLPALSDVHHGLLLQKPPETRRDDVRDVLHGVEILDPYRWLEDPESPETRTWVEAQNGFTRSILDSLPGRSAIRKRISEIMRIERIEMPIVRNGIYFFSKRKTDEEQSVLYMRKGFHGEDEVLIDPNPLNPNHTKSIQLLDVSKDGSLLAYGIREGGEDEIIIRLFDVKERRDLPDRWEKGRYLGFSLRPDKKGLYYSRHGEEGSRVYSHEIGKDPHTDQEIFGEGYEPDKGISANLSEDGRYLLFHVWHGSGGKKSEIYIQDVEKGGAILPIVNDVDARFSGQIAGDKLYLRTNWNAPNGRILVVDLKNPSRNKWREVIPEGEEVIRGLSLVGGRIFITTLKNVRSQLKIFQPDGKYLGEMDLPAIGSVSDLAGQWKDKEAFFSFSSFHIPSLIYRCDVRNGKREIWSRIQVPINTEKFEVQQVWFESKDRTKVPMFLVHEKGIPLDGKNPALLTGYGGFNASLTPYFSTTGALWIERGGVYAVPNLRGGGEFGEEWHRGGMLEKKQNVFDDFIAAAEWLIEKGYTNPSKLAISGRSNGGLLVGACLTQRPDLFQAVVCGYPLLDMVRYHKFLVAPLWISEYGSSEDPDQFQYLYAYSPYHHVVPGTQYPAVLFITVDLDTRVDPSHARKMAALLQHSNSSEKPILLRYETRLGHSGGQPMTNEIEDLTDELSFLFWQLGVMAE